LVRGAIERSKPSVERLSSYSDSQLPAREQQLFNHQTVYAPLEQLQLEFWLDAASQYLDTGNSTIAVLLGNEAPQELRPDFHNPSWATKRYVSSFGKEG
jgi:hypothetical protein